MKHPGLRISGDGLRKAVKWLSDNHRHDLAAIEEVSFRFDLSPLDEQFLLDHFRDPPPDPNADID